jgi:hypothetical protein
MSYQLNFIGGHRLPKSCCLDRESHLKELQRMSPLCTVMQSLSTFLAFRAINHPALTGSLTNNLIYT